MFDAPNPGTAKNQTMPHLRKSKTEHIRLGIFIAVFALLGIAVLVTSRAATPGSHFESERSQVTSPAITAAETSASAGSFLQFGAGTATPVPPAPPPGGGYAGLGPGTAWHWQIQGVVDENILGHVVPADRPKMMDIDLWDATPQLISRLKAKGIYVVCYMESGDWLSERPDAKDYPTSVLGARIDGFPNERYVNVTMLDGPAGPTGKTLRQIMFARLQMAKDKGCQGIEPDLDDLHEQGNVGFPINKAQMLTYNKIIIDRGHQLGMSVGLKNGPGFAAEMYNAGADWVLNEECWQFDECGGYKIFTDHGKAVFQVEYQDSQKNAKYRDTCPQNVAQNYDGIVRDSSSGLGANSFRYACRGTTW